MCICKLCILTDSGHKVEIGPLDPEQVFARQVC